MTTRSATLLPLLPSGTALGARGRALWRRLEQLTVYVPVVLMALLALASYWLLRSTPQVPVPVAKAPPQHIPTDVMRGFSVRTYGPGGVLKSEVFGREARLYPDDGSMEIDDSRLRNISPQGVVTTSVARRVWANSAQDEFVLTGNAVVVREAARLPDGENLQRLEFRGEHLHVYSTTRQVTSDQPVLLIRGDSRMTANQLTYTEDGPNRVAVLTGRVRATLVGQARR
ncbi:MAG TPA: LPS export ABC transporter periplasmic protein LptC [Burkholderiaceae bacterium]|nr:LPS export ABC transporter periplasmic protein LptC [Burkholderiaceae bacterium]